MVMRGGDSRALFFYETDLPLSPEQRDMWILNALGSPDRRQINGLGGADPSTSKVVLMGKSSSPDADVLYTHAQVGIAEPVVDFSQYSGNLTSAVGLFAVQAGWVLIQEPETHVRILNTNSGRMIYCSIAVENGRPVFLPDGIRDPECPPGVPVSLDFSGTVGSLTGALLPTGRPMDWLYIPELGRKVAVSLVDLAQPTVFFAAHELGMNGTEGPSDISPEQLALFWAIRRESARVLGLATNSLPTPTAVAAPAAYTRYTTGEQVLATEVNLLARRVVGPDAPKLHKAYAATGACCTAVAAVLPGTVVHAVAAPAEDGVVRIGHPSGVFPVKVRLHGGTVVEVSYLQTARRIMEGVVYI
ncbi:MAG: hypothetical protein K6T31_01015 [Alicyclobacillus sp.]|nr:hypothetical protein [Alicyclobacillus sp.]